MTKLKRNILLAILPIFLGGVIWVSTFSGDNDPQIQTMSSFHPEPEPIVSDTAEEVALAGIDYSNTNSELNQLNNSGITYTDTDQASAKTDEIDNKLAGIEKELRELQVAMNDLINNADSESSLSTDPAVQQQLADMSNQKEQLAYEFIESTFVGEAVDFGWEPEANSKISESLSKINNLTSSVVECATTMCRINAVISGEQGGGEEQDNAMAMMHLLNGELSWEGQMHITVNHETGEMTAYLARPGNTLPQVAN